MSYLFRPEGVFPVVYTSVCTNKVIYAFVLYFIIYQKFNAISLGFCFHKKPQGF